MTATKGSLATWEYSWMARATSSLPVPVSPVIRTGASEAAERPICFQIASIAALVPRRALRPSSLGGRGQRLGQGALLERALQGLEEDGEIEGLGQVVEGAVAHGLDGAVAVAVGGGDDDRDLAERAFAELAQELEAAPVAEADVEEDAVDRLAPEERAGLAEAGRGEGAVAQPLDGRGQALADAALVLDDEDRAHAEPSAVAARRTRGKTSSKQVVRARRS